MTPDTKHAARCQRRHNILILDNSFEMGGLETKLYDFLRLIDTEHFRVSVCCLKQGGYFEPKLRELGIPFYGNILSHKFDALAFLKLRDIIKRERIDLIYTFIHPNTLIFAYCAKAMGLVKHFIVSFHATESSSGGTLVKSYLKPLLSDASGLLAVAHDHKRFLINEGGMTDSNWAVIHNGVDSERFKPGPRNHELIRALGIPDDSFVVTTVASLKPIKRVDLFLDACANLLPAIPNSRFVIVGDGRDRPLLEDQARALGIMEHTHFCGIREDVDEVLRLTDVYVLSSDSEAFPNVVLEAMASAVPVVATDVGSVRELVEDRSSGYIIPAGERGALTDALFNYAHSPDTRRRFGTRGREIVEREFGLSAMVRKRESFFSDLLCHD